MQLAIKSYMKKNRRKTAETGETGETTDLEVGLAGNLHDDVLTGEVMVEEES